jgi:hypothetical protein
MTAFSFECGAGSEKPSKALLGFNPEACHVQARYMPGKRTIEDLVVGGFHCPRRT